MSISCIMHLMGKVLDLVSISADQVLTVVLRIPFYAKWLGDTF